MLLPMSCVSKRKRRCIHLSLSKMGVYVKIFNKKTNYTQNFVEHTVLHTSFVKQLIFKYCKLDLSCLKSLVLLRTMTWSKIYLLYKSAFTIWLQGKASSFFVKIFFCFFLQFFLVLKTMWPHPRHNNNKNAELNVCPKNIFI